MRKCDKGPQFDIMKTIIHQKLPTNWDQREKLRDKGQFWTPDWVAEAMVAYVAQDADVIFDPGVGKGAFYTALKKIAPRKKFFGTDIDPEIIATARREGIFRGSPELEVRDFIMNPPQGLFSAIVANPPYIRHHRLSAEYKERFKEISFQTVGSALDGRAGLHIYFLVQALRMLEKDGRLAFIMPADTCEGVFAKKLWDWIGREYCIDAVVTFDSAATPFPGVDTNALIFLIRNAKPQKTVPWIQCLEIGSQLAAYIKGGLRRPSHGALRVHNRDLGEALRTGLSREPREYNDVEYTLADYARVMRGIVTGANEFFFLTRKKADNLGIPDSFLSRAIGRTRDISDEYLSEKTLENLEQKGRPTLLFSPNGFSWQELPATVKNYLLQGEQMGLPSRALISTRQPWYKMEEREVPIFLFAYLGRRNTRFIRNDVGILPLTAFLCVYPHSNDSEYVDKLWKILQHPDTISNLKLVGKSYGSGAIKVEPRSLERLPIPAHLIKRSGLQSRKSVTSLELFPVAA